VKIFSSTTELAAATLTADQIVKVKSVGDYRIQDSGTGIALANGKIAVPQASGTAVNVLQFGATGDGTTDDTAAIQAAIDAAGTVYVPTGTYLVTASLSISDNTADTFTMYGDGRDSVIISTAAIDVIDIEGALGNSIQYVTLDSITVTANNVSGVSIRTRWDEFLSIRNCIINGTGVGIYMAQNANEDSIKPTITNCVFGQSTYGIRGGDTRVADAWITDNIFLNNTVRCISFGYLDGGTIRGNKLFSDNGAANNLDGILLGRSLYVNIEDNAFFEMGGSAITLTSPRRMRVRNNFIFGTGDNSNDAAIDIYDYNSSIVMSDVQITGNTVREVEGHGIKINSAASNAEKIKINDNFFFGVGTGSVAYDAIVLQKTDAVEVKDNVIEGDSATRYWLYLDAATNTRIRNNDHTGCINADVYRINSPSLVVEDSRKVLTGVTTTQTLTFDTDAVIGGVLTVSIYMNLPAANSCSGKLMTFTKTDASVYSLILDPSGSQTIDGAATKNVSTQYETVSLISDGANWFTV